MLKKLALSGTLIASLLAGSLSSFAAPGDPSTSVFLPNDLLYQHDFNDGVGLPWHVVETIPAKCEFDISGGTYNIKIVNKGKERWDIQFRHRALKIQSGHKYTVKFSVTASNACSIYPKIGDQKDPYFEDWNYNNRSWALMSLPAGSKKTVNETFTATRSGDVCEFAFHLADSTVPVGTVFKFDDMHLEDPQFNKPTPGPVPAPRKIRANHMGYYQFAEKKATFPANSKSPVAWTLEDSTGKVVKTGQSKVFGDDKDSGEPLHVIDFSDFTTIGKGYILRAGMSDYELKDADGKPVENFTFPFDISPDIYSEVKYDALKYFYHNRSGIAIEMPYAVKDEWERPAGHPKDVAKVLSERGYSSSASKDVTGGWYDAGDHGKYVVNGGISVWTLMNLYERAKVQKEAGNSKAMDAIDDGKLNIPEKSNSIPDILDETRWQMEFMLKMQVDAGNPKAGMAYHKMHDIVWTGLAVAPHEDPEDRIIKPPSTAATLNLAATGAQTYRIWKDIDSTFANKCLSAAEVAWKAALATPDMYAPFDDSVGGGPYGDNYVKDDFYWAAAELFISTGKSEYLDYIKSSPHYLEAPSKLTNGEAIGNVGGMDWGNTQALGTLSLALVKSDLPAADVEKARKNIQTACDTWIAIQDKQGYGIPIEQAPFSDGLTGYPWGSNSFVLNQGMVFAYAYDYSGNPKYFNAATESMDYIFGRNPNAKSYVTGHGENCLENPHHRFFSFQIDLNYPTCPPGFVSGGPNSGLEDPWVKGSGWLPRAFPPQKCFMDHIESWSTNEVTINWNAPFAWVMCYLDEVGPKFNVDGPTTTPGQTPGQTPVPGSKGDLNKDGSIDSTDLALCKRMILGIANNGDKNNADVNSDGSVDSTDLALIKRHILGIKKIS